jgi:hypothetical protein
VISGRAFLGTGVAALLAVGVLPALTSTASAVVPPDKMVLLGGAATAKFASVYVANADGSGAKIVHNGSATQAPELVSLAPANNRIVEIFAKESKATPTSSIAVMNLDGSGYRILTTLPATDFVSGVRWNHAGTKILVSLETENGSAYLGLVNPSLAHPHLVKLAGSTGLRSGAFANLTDATVVASNDSGAIVTLKAGKTHLVLDPPTDGALSSPVLSPDDATITFSAFSVTSTTETSRIETVSSDGLVGPTTLASSGINVMPAWSSDGLTVFYNQFGLNSDTIRVFAVPASGSGSPTKVSLPTTKQYELEGVAPRDTTAPSVAPALKVTLNGAKPVVSWTLPSDADVSHVIVSRLDGATAPSSPSAGFVVYSGPKTSVTDLATPGQTYSYAVWVVDGAGNVSAAREKSFVALRAPALKAPPLVSSVSNDTTFPVSWTPSVSNAIGTTYQVDVLNSAGTWVGWQNGVTTTSATFGAAGSPVTPAAGKTYGLRAYVTDTYGNTSSKAAQVWVEPKDDRAGTARGGWTKATSSNDWLGTSRTTTRASASLSIGLTGSTLWIIGDRLPTGSHAAVYVDGKKVATINTLGHTLHRHVLWTKKVKAGKHIVRIVNLATRHHARLSIDGFAAA